MIKRIHTTNVYWDRSASLYETTLTFTTQWDMEKTLVLMQPFYLDGEYYATTTDIKIRPIYWDWQFNGYNLRILCDWGYAYANWNFPVTLIEFY